MKTIKQIADELQVSKTAVRKKIENIGLSDKVQTNGNRIVVNERQESLIKSTFLQNETQTKNENEVCEKTETLRLVSDIVSTLTQQLQEKDKQIQQQQQSIKELTAALENTTNSLKAAQALHAGTMQQNLLAEKEEAEKQALAENKDKLEENSALPNALVQNAPMGNAGIEKQKKWYEFWR